MQNPCFRCGKQLVEEDELLCPTCEIRTSLEMREIKERVERDRNQIPVDMVNHPPHYQGRFEVIDILYDKLGREGFEAYCIGNVMKYVMRYKGKNGIEDLEKSQWYLNKVIELIKAPK